MKVLYIHQYFCTREGKSGTRSYEFSKHLVRQGHEVTIITSTSALTDVRIPAGRRQHEFEIEGIRVIAVNVPYSQNMGSFRRIWSFLRFMLQSSWIACKQKGHDVIFATSTPLTVGIPALLASWWERTPFVFEVRDLWPEAPIQMRVIRNPLVIRLLRLFESFVYRKSAHVVALSPGMKDGVVEAGTALEKVSVVPNCSDLDLFQPGDASAEVVQKYGLQDKFVVTHAGSMGAANGLETLIEAAASVQESGAEDVQFVIVGQGSTEDKLRGMVYERGLENVTFTGGLARREVAEILKASNVCLVLFRNLPVLATNSPNKLFDALAAGRAVIVNSNGWTKELVQEHGVGLAAEPGSPASLAQCVLELRADQEKRAAMARSARKLAEDRFDRAQLAQRITAILLRAASGGFAEPADSSLRLPHEVPAPAVPAPEGSTEVSAAS